jgi:hypothetical protein
MRTNTASLALLLGGIQRAGDKALQKQFEAAKRKGEMYCDEESEREMRPNVLRM